MQFCGPGDDEVLAVVQFWSLAMMKPW